MGVMGTTPPMGNEPGMWATAQCGGQSCGVWLSWLVVSMAGDAVQFMAMAGVQGQG